MNVNLIGLSVDRVHSHLKWTDWIEEELDVDIGFPIIADEGGHVGKQFGMIQLHAGINLVGLGQPTSCPGKDSRLEWIDSRYGQTTGCKRGTNWPFITTGRLLEVIYREDYGYKKQEPEFMTFGHRARIKRASLEAPLRTTGEEKRRTSWQPSTRLMPSTERAPFRSRPAACRKKESGPWNAGRGPLNTPRGGTSCRLPRRKRLNEGSRLYHGTAIACWQFAALIESPSEWTGRKATILSRMEKTATGASFT